MELSAYIYAFIIGGAICVIGQLLISLTRLTSAKGAGAVRCERRGANGAWAI